MCQLAHVAMSPEAVTIVQFSSIVRRLFRIRKDDMHVVHCGRGEDNHAPGKNRLLMDHLSVAMCTFNGAGYLQEQLDSIAAQTRSPDELIACDDGSTDETLAILKAFSSTSSFPVHVYVNEKNLGSTRNFEKAIKLAEGNVIVLCDQDDVWHLEKLLRIETILSESPHIGAVFSDAEVVDERLQSLGYGLWDSVGFNEREKSRVMNGNAVQVLLKHNVVTGATMALRAEYKDLILPIPESWIHDAWIALLIASVAELGIIHEPLIKYRQHFENQIGTDSVNKWQDFKEQTVTGTEDDKDNYVQRMHQYRELVERLASVRKLSCSGDVMVEIEAKIAHLDFRAHLPKQITRRLPLAFRELVTLRYHRHSKGVYSFAKDVFF